MDASKTIKLYGVCRQRGECVCGLCADIAKPVRATPDLTSGRRQTRSMTVAELSDYLAIHGKPPTKYYVELEDL